MRSLALALALAALLPGSLAFSEAAAAHHARSRNRAAHRSLAAAVLDKRQGFGGRATFYDVGLGACGSYNGPGDFIVALNTPQFGGGYPGPNCGRALTISYGGKTTTAVVMDQCPGCGYGDLDMSRGLFNFFASEDMGTFHMSWAWADSAPAPSPPPAPTPPPPPPPPSSTSEAMPSTTSPPPPPPPPSSSSSNTPAPSSTLPSAAPTSSAPRPSSAAAAAPTLLSSANHTLSISASHRNHTATLSADLSGIGDVVASSVSGSIGAAAASATTTATAVPGMVDPDQGGTGLVADGGNLVLLNQAVANLGRVVIVGAQL